MRGVAITKELHGGTTKESATEESVEFATRGRAATRSPDLSLRHDLDRSERGKRDWHPQPKDSAAAAPAPARLGELLYFAPNGRGESSLGHIAVDIDGTTYSWSPGGMHIEPTLDYLRRNSFRDAFGFPLRLSSKEAGQLETSLQDYGRHHKYDIFRANCTDPLEDGLQQLGYPIARSLLPLGVKDSLVFNGLIEGNGYRYHPADPAKKRPWWDPNAPWSVLGGP